MEIAGFAGTRNYSKRHTHKKKKVLKALHKWPMGTDDEVGFAVLVDES